MAEHKRHHNEKKFGSWEELPGGGRRYWYEVEGHLGWKARYYKEVDAEETTVRFFQEIYNDRGMLVEMHQKFPIDTGHKKVE